MMVANTKKIDSYRRTESRKSPGKPFLVLVRRRRK